jgi:phosphatidylserine decarboxylase
MPLLSPHGKPQITIIALLGLAGVGGGVALAYTLPYPAIGWSIAGLLATVAAGALAFFRDPDRTGPEGPGLVIASADGHISSIHDVDHYEPFDGPAKCIRTFLSILDVHVTRCPLAGEVASSTRKAGAFISALKPESAEQNESTTTIFVDPETKKPIYALRHVAGAVARRIVCPVDVGQQFDQGDRLGLMKFGSTTEVYLPNPDQVEVKVAEKQYVWGGKTVIAVMAPQG